VDRVLEFFCSQEYGPRYALMSGSGLVSRVTPVQTALRNYTGDEGGPFGFGDQVAHPKPPQAAAVKAVVVSVVEKSGQ
jgi:hypothetical protein